ncbi:MAG: homoserine dehydrogenase [Proteobacteria bacterium]|nr:homoserine dehydrogenase [Pseudomonadota bacterium]MDA1355001.1 homoserine dehydrogenase [Pseudomonadota bacterium]
MSDAVRIGLAGLGVVGGGVLKLLDQQNTLLQSRLGRRLDVVAVSAREREKNRTVDISSLKWYDNPLDLAADPDIDVVCELMGGGDGIALELSQAALRNGKHLVTANKALLAYHGNSLAGMAEENAVNLGYEAAVAGGIPIIKALREGLIANKFSGVYGILNGTCNYILTEMRDGVRAGVPRDFDAVLKEAQELGYAEADPSTDVDGIDAAHKLALLTSLVFGCPVDFEAVQIEGIRHINPIDIRFAEELGYRVKLLGVSRASDAGIEQSVHPCMVPENTAIAHVDGVLNAVVTEGDFVGTTTFEGPGAGAGPTASAVISDLADISRGLVVPVFGVPVSALVARPKAPPGSHVGSYYIRLMVVDRPGVIADIAACLRDQEVSVESLLQHGRRPDEAVPVVLTTHVAEEGALVRALAAMDELHTVLETPRMIRIVNLS